ncbi:YhgE/Pip domain-containing protein [Gryllotalpicola ginsengisoli]|uniref:YhgE/Pip domain-containing protein n=1 Tax=Gryllotalpicola ginsengisoli TaxID=444608 RepID=UPI0003B338B5|nr:YhgE/Pip domain-containing protein [Gryllotalpicola ginsengisoli]
MTLFTALAERAGSRRRLTVLSIVGIVLVPFVIAGVLVWALWNPQDRLDTLKAAIVNDDQPVTVSGQTVPLGRQLAAGLVGDAKPGSKKAQQNFDWVITDASDASAGLASGEYTAVITIPKGFSAAATSSAEKPSDARQATIQVRTSKASKVLDSTISQTIAQTAADTMGTALTGQYLDNVYVGFNTLGDKLDQAASGAKKLASQGGSLVSGAQQLATGADGLTSGTAQLASGASSLAGGSQQLATGASSLAAGSSQLASAAQSVSGAASQVSTGAAGVATGTAGVAQGLSTLNDSVQSARQQLDAIAGGLTQLGAVSSQLSGLGARLSALQPAITACSAGDQTQCAAVGQSIASLSGDQSIASLAGAAQAAAGGSGSGSAQTVDPSSIVAQVDAAADGVQQLSDSAASVAGAAAQVSTGAAGVATGTAQLASGAQQSASGAAQLASGAQQSASGGAQLASAAQQVASGAAQLAPGAQQLADGVSKYVDGVGTLASGLKQAAGSIPSYTDAERKTLSSVVADPVAARSGAAAGFGELAAPLFAVLALWLGALATFLLIRPFSARALGSPRSALQLALQGLALPAGIGVVQGLAVAAALQPLLQLGVGPWFALAGAGALAGVAFAAVNQALAAVLGGAWRFVSMLVILLGLATALVGTAPQFMVTLSSATPIAPGQQLVSAVVQGLAVPGGAIAALALWLVGSVAVTVLAIARQRMVPAARLAAVASPA